MKSAIEGGLKQSPDTVTSITQLDFGPANGAERCGHAEPMMWCFVAWPSKPPIKQLTEFNEQYSVNCEVLYFVLRLFPFKSFYEENGFLCL